MTTLRHLPKTGALALAAALSWAPTAFAEDPPAAPAPKAPAGEPPMRGRFFDTYDGNQDGKVTREEYKAADPAADMDVFDLYDSDKDGVITLAELGLPADFKPTPTKEKKDEPLPGARQAGAMERAERFKKMLAEMDLDKDGKISKAEWKGKAAFEVMDRNKDGFISAEDGPGGKGAGMPGMGMPTPEEAMARFKEMDKNGDGRVAKDEFAGPPERFAMLDRDGDGAISQTEFEAALKGGAAKAGGKIFQRFDANGDGKVTRAEFPGGDENFKALDKNGDGAITLDEVGDGKGLKPGKGPGEGEPGTPPPPGEKPAPGGETPPMGGGDMGGGDMGGAAPPPAPAGGIGALFASLDKNKDGKLSREEFPGTDDEWRRLDKDANGWITPEEAGAPAPNK